MFDVSEHLDGLRCRETPWLIAHREHLVREQRRLRVEELTVTLVLDERGTRSMKDCPVATACRCGRRGRRWRRRGPSSSPHRDWTLTGNPNQPDGLRLERRVAGGRESRAGPGP
jgi:hypothetical protein